MKEIVDISVDKELGMTEVSIRVPKFENFGQRLGELERKASEAFRAQLVEPESDPELEAEIEADMAESFEMLKTSMDSMKKGLDSMPEGPAKKMMKQMCEEFSKTDEEPEAEEASEDEAGPEQGNEDRFTYDLQALRVSLADDMAWDKSAEARVDQLLADWPSIRPAVLQHTFKYYRKLYPELVKIFGDSSGKEFTLPKPIAPEIVADLFAITAIYLHDDGGIGLGGHCTWDEEHGYGVMIKNSKVVVVGHESEAFC